MAQSYDKKQQYAPVKIRDFTGNYTGRTSASPPAPLQKERGVCMDSRCVCSYGFCQNCDFCDFFDFHDVETDNYPSLFGIASRYVEAKSKRLRLQIICKPEACF